MPSRAFEKMMNFELKTSGFNSKFKNLEFKISLLLTRIAVIVYIPSVILAEDY